uniref:Vacuolar protein-sorting-associated protein 25 n=1 Tax=Amphiprion ocellaris TaxID=80972 RepID=A0A3Q1CFB0_AMPOC
MSFEWPWQYNFPPFFTLQPNVDTRQKQLAAWCSLALSYCRHHKLYTLDVMEAQESPVFNNKKIERKLSIEAIQVVFEELRKKGNLEWLDKNKSRCLVMWRRPEEWGKLIYQWVSKNGMVNSVFTLYELSNGDDTEGEDFHGLEEWMLLRSLQALQTEGKAEIITMDDGKDIPKKSRNTTPEGLIFILRSNTSRSGTPQRLRPVLLPSAECNNSGLHVQFAVFILLCSSYCDAPVICHSVYIQPLFFISRRKNKLEISYIFFLFFPFFFSKKNVFLNEKC